MARELARSLGPDIYTSDWTLQHATFFRAVEIEKRMMFLIVLLIIVVAAFNIVSSLMMAVKDKNADIAILRTLGASPGGITKIFLIQGTIIALLGTLLGLIGGVSLALNVETVVPFIENVLGFKFLAKDVYQISDLPSELRMPGRRDDRDGVLSAHAAGDRSTRAIGRRRSTRRKRSRYE